MNVQPIGLAAEASGRNYLEPILSAPLAKGLERKDVLNPNRWLRRAVRALNIQRTTVIAMSTKVPGGGLVNSSYVRENADTTKLDATFWLARARTADGASFRHLLYTQTIVLEFDDIQWPHVTVGILTQTSSSPSES